MGTPKKKYRRQRELVSPTIAERFQMLEIGKKTGQELNFEKLPDVLEGAKGILLPLVSWLDKPIFPEAEFVNYPAPKEFQRKRGVRLFESGVIDIWLERSGMWFLRFRGFDRPQAIFQEVDSRQLAEIMLQKSDDFLRRSLKEVSILEEMPFLKDVALYDTLFLRFLSQFFKTAKSLIEEREKRLRLMGEWLNLLDDFSQSLDPLISQGKTVSIKGYSIWEEHKRGTSRCTEDYLCPEALKPFWETLKSRHSVRSKYREFVTEHSFESLEELLRRLGWIFEEIKRARSRDETSADSLFGSNTGRLEFTEEEIAVLKKLVDSITATA